MDVCDIGKYLYGMESVGLTSTGSLTIFGLHYPWMYTLTIRGGNIWAC